jgi:uncharacterized phage protein (TIGR01671 family)
VKDVDLELNKKKRTILLLQGYKMELRFRAWDAATKRMIDLHTITPLALDSNLKIDGVFIPFNGMPIMQYTGIHDKNGREIFDGDILKKDNPEYWGDSELCPTPNERDVKTWGGGTGRVESVPFGWTVININCGDWAFNDPEGPHWNGDQVEVIGNIYENPELLKKVERGDE